MFTYQLRFNVNNEVKLCKFSREPGGYLGWYLIYDPFSDHFVKCKLTKHQALIEGLAVVINSINGRVKMVVDNAGSVCDVIVIDALLKQFEQILKMIKGLNV